MPQLVKGGRWVFGWVIVGLQGRLTVPPAAALDLGADETKHGCQRGRGIVTGCLELNDEMGEAMALECAFSVVGQRGARGRPTLLELLRRWRLAQVGFELRRQHLRVRAAMRARGHDLRTRGPIAPSIERRHVRDFQSSRVSPSQALGYASSISGKNAFLSR